MMISILALLLVMHLGNQVAEAGKKDCHCIVPTRFVEGFLSIYDHKKGNLTDMQYIYDLEKKRTIKYDHDIAVYVDIGRRKKYVAGPEKEGICNSDIRLMFENTIPRCIINDTWNKYKGYVDENGYCTNPISYKTQFRSYSKPHTLVHDDDHFYIQFADSVNFGQFKNRFRNCKDMPSHAFDDA